jgi:prepilin-type N-terminal cleavage/methylation domain-containing protein
MSTFGSTQVGRTARSRRRSPGPLREQSGFTLVELLVVLLILAILSAIAIPSFFSQREKARDADAKADLAVARTAMETYSADNDGTYVGASTPALVEIEPTLVGLTLNVGSLTERTYVIEVVSADGQTFSAERAAGGTVSLTCRPPGEGGCPDDGEL